MRVRPPVSTTSFLAVLSLAGLMVGCDAAAGPPPGEAAPSRDAAPSEVAAASAAAGQLGTASVELDGATHRFVVIGCKEGEDDPTGMLEFAGTGVHPDVPRSEIDAALQADAEDDGSDLTASMARNVQTTERFLEFGPAFSWYRTTDGEDGVIFLTDAGALRGEPGWGTVTLEEPLRFIERDGDSFRGTSPAEHMSDGRAASLNFEARCP